MLVTCTQENLNKGLNLVSHLANKNVNLPILDSVLLKVKNNLLKVCTTNLEVGCTSLIRGKIDEEGEIAIPAKVLSDYISLLPKDSVELKLEDGDLKIICNNYKTKIKGSTTSEFPLIPTVAEAQGIILSTEVFKDALQQVVFAATVNDIRPEISGVLFNINQTKLTLVATDSYRLAEKEIEIDNQMDNSEEETNITIPLRTVQEILRVLGSTDDMLTAEEESKVNLFIEDNQILLKNDITELVSKLVEGQYPDYRQIVPQDFKTNVIINRNELIKAIKSTSLFAKSGVYDIFFNFDTSKKELEVFAENSQLGKNSVKINAQISGENNEITLNYKYLLDGLQGIKSEQVVLDVVDGATPCVVRPYQNESTEKDYLYLVMPIRQ